MFYFHLSLFACEVASKARNADGCRIHVPLARRRGPRRAVCVLSCVMRVGCWLGGGGMLHGGERGRGAGAAAARQEARQTAGEPRRVQPAVAPARH